MHPAKWEQFLSNGYSTETLYRKIYTFEDNRRIELDNKRNKIKAKPPAAIQLM